MMLNDELERIWEKLSWPNQALSGNLSGGAEENHEKPQ
jgi:hypothetical protein